MSFIGFHYRRQLRGGKAAASGSASEPVDPDVRAGPDPAAVAGERHIVGIDRVENAIWTAGGRRKTRQRRSLRLERPLERAVHPAAGARRFVADDHIGNSDRKS